MHLNSNRDYMAGGKLLYRKILTLHPLPLALVTTCTNPVKAQTCHEQVEHVIREINRASTCHR
eukprot:1743940-Amphidinium_carterae.2